MKNHPFSVIIPYPMMKKKAHLLFLAAPPSSLSTIREIREIRSLSSIIPSPLPNNHSRPTIRVHPTHMYLTFEKFVKFVVFQVLVRFYSIEKV